ncbi:MAG TPA: TylF/MycF/NovP-related O-methyltransferase [Chitinophagaceae bacterium]|nr:TylF/MycF/NovP-related O-methyltransferase [Chitinophagaceae bacterium]HNU15004.1 TylF/MycF/NovP-related O-methyltransferase [Chitinophagaceae bacterium]
MKLFFIRYIKIAFIYLKLHLFFGLFKSIYANLLYLTRLSSWAQKNRKISYNDFPSKWNYEKRYPMYEWVLEKESLLTTPVNYLEFGVAAGQSFKWFLGKNTHPESRFAGFDTFTGLPEDFGVYKKGTFNSDTEAPKIEDTRGKFYQGLFQQTLPGFLAEFDNKNRNVIMMDADIYSATLYVLTSIAPFLKKGDIIFFDEFAVPTHEFKAYQDFIQSYYTDMELIAAANNYYFTAFKIR